MISTLRERPGALSRGRMRRLLSACLFLTAAGVHGAVTQTSHRFQTTLKKTVAYEYLRALPLGYEATGERRWPLLLFLHGSGERGSDVQRVARHGPPKLLAGGSTLTESEAAAGRALAENFIVISPQCPTWQLWHDDAVLALLDAVCAELKVDPARVYLSGLSMGGYGTWSLALRHPQRFAAIVPICGGGRLLDILISRGAAREAMQSLGVRAFHGAKDPTVPMTESQRMVESLRRAGAKDVELTVYPEAKHDSWTETYAKPELYEWLLTHARNATSN